MFGELLELALELLRGCDCSGAWGCPACVQHAGCGEYNAVLHKEAAVAILELTLAAQAEFRERARLQQARPPRAAAAGLPTGTRSLLQCRTRGNERDSARCLTWPARLERGPDSTPFYMSLSFAVRRGQGLEAKNPACV